MQAAYRRFQESAAAPDYTRHSRSSASPTVIQELKQQLAASEKLRADAERQARDAMQSSGNFAATQALRAEQQLQLAVEEARADAACKVVQEVEKHSARVLAELPGATVADECRVGYGLSPVSSVKQMLRGAHAETEQDQLLTLSSAVVCLTKERDELSARSKQSVATLEASLAKSRSKREAELLDELAAVKAAVEDATEQARIDRDMRGFYASQLEDARKDAATREMARGDQVPSRQKLRELCCVNCGC